MSKTWKTGSTIDLLQNVITPEVHVNVVTAMSVDFLCCERSSCLIYVRCGSKALLEFKLPLFGCECFSCVRGAQSTALRVNK